MNTDTPLAVTLAWKAVEKAAARIEAALAARHDNRLVGPAFSQAEINELRKTAAILGAHYADVYEAWIYGELTE